MPSEHHVRRAPALALLFHGELDPTIDWAQGVAFAAALRAAGGRAEAVICPMMSHAIPVTPEIAAKFDAYIEELRARSRWKGAAKGH